MTPEEAQARLDALVLAGWVAAPPAVLALWQQVREREPEAWHEMARWVVVEGEPDMLRALYRQCDTVWGCTHPLGEALCEAVRALVDAMVESWR